jgi:uncharacterized membrane protein YjgN (DUF898 family)
MAATLEHETSEGRGGASEPALPLEFTGRAGEFFRIWIVNLCLTIVSLGIYSAWAKVRTRRYFYSSTLLDGSPFEYTADPKRILIGRLIVLAMALSYTLAGAFNERLAGAVAILVFLATPWLVVRSLAFHRRNSRLRNVRFVFSGTYREAAKVFIGWPLAAVLSLGLLFPWIHGRQHQFVVSNTSYGATPFEFSWRAASYYWIYLKAFGVVLLVALGLALLLPIVGLPSTGANDQISVPNGFILVSVAAYLIILVGTNAVIRAGSTNLLYGNSSVGPHGFRGHLRSADLFGLYAISALAIVFTLGLAIPWVMVRLARYRVERIGVLARGNLDDFFQAAEEEHPLGAVAEEAAGALDFGFDFGL